MFHYILVVVIILLIIGYQVYSYSDTKKKIQNYRDIFPADITAYTITELLLKEDDSDDLPDDTSSNENVDEVVVSQVSVDGNSNTIKEIVQAINKYLQKNRGAASDFHLMKDMVERYCDAEADEIATQQPIPLYLGLMGTMVGIIVGIGSIAFSGGLAATTMMDHITELMVCVAIAMSASLVGVYCTTRIAWQSKNANSEVEAEKNRFYSWLQTELLPVLSGNTASAIYLLQQNLLSFNKSFKKNVDGLSSALSQISDSSHEQVELIELIRDIDIRRVAQANIQVLRELRECTGEITRFNTYLHNVSGYLEAVNALNSNINEHLNRTAAIERMGAFFEREIEQVQSREQYINQVVANVDNTLRDTFNALKESTESGVRELKNSSATEFDTLKDTLTEEKHAFKESLISGRNEFADYVREQKELLAQKANEIVALSEEIKTLSETKSSIEKMVLATTEQSAKLDTLINVLRNQKPPVVNISGKDSPSSNVPFVATPMSMPRWVKPLAIVGVSLLLGIFCLRLLDFLHNSGNANNTVNEQPINSFYPNSFETVLTDTLERQAPDTLTIK